MAHLLSIQLQWSPGFRGMGRKHAAQQWVRKKGGGEGNHVMLMVEKEKKETVEWNRLLTEKIWHLLADSKMSERKEQFALFHDLAFDNDASFARRINQQKLAQLCFVSYARAEKKKINSFPHQRTHWHVFSLPPPPSSFSSSHDSFIQGP